MKKAIFGVITLTLLLSSCSCSVVDGRGGNTSVESEGSTSESIHNPVIDLMFYKNDRRDMLLSTTRIEGTSFVWKSSLYQGETPTLEEEGFENTFIGWVSEDYNVILKENISVDMNDYTFENSSYGQKKDGTDPEFKISYDGNLNRYRVIFGAKWEKKSVGYTVTFAAPDGYVYDEINVPSVDIGSYEYLNVGAKYLGKNPAYYNEEYPTKFAGWDVSLNVVTKNVTATAMFEKDGSLGRMKLAKNAVIDSLNRTYNISTLHNLSQSVMKVKLYRGSDFVKEVSIDAGRSYLIDITERINGLQANPPLNCSGDYALCLDYYYRFIPESVSIGELQSNGTYSIDLTDDYEEQTIQVVGRAKITNGNNVSYTDFTKLRVRLNLNTHLVIYSGITDVNIEYVDPTSKTDYGGPAIVAKRIQVPESVRNVEFYGSDRVLYNGDGLYYLGNESNHYLIAYRGEASRLAKDCVSLMGGKLVSAYGYPDVKNEAVVPASVTCIRNFDFNNFSVRFEDSRKLEVIRTIEKANLGRSFELSKDCKLYDDEGEYPILSECTLGELVLPTCFDVNYNPLYKCDVDSYRVYRVEGQGTYLNAEDDELYRFTTANEYIALLGVPTNKLESDYSVRDGVQTIARGAFDDGLTNPTLKTVILPSSVTSVKSQNTSATFYTSGSTPTVEGSMIIYGCELDGTPIKVNGITYGLLNDEAYVLSYEQASVNQEMVIPDEISARGNTYPVVAICERALKDVRINSLSIGKNVRKIDYEAFRGARINSDIFIPDNVIWLNSTAFRDITASSPIEFSVGREAYCRLGVGESIKKNDSISKYIARVDTPSDLFRNHEVGKGIPFPVKERRDEEGNPVSDYDYLERYKNDVSNLFYEINGVRTCFDEPTHLDIQIPFNLGYASEINYFFPNVTSVTYLLTLTSSNFWNEDDEMIRDVFAYGFFDYLFGATTRNDLDSSHARHGVECDGYYVDATEEELVDYFVRVEYEEFVGYNNGNPVYTYKKVFSYEDGIFYIKENKVGDVIPSYMSEGTYQIPIRDGSYNFQLRYL